MKEALGDQLQCVCSTVGFEREIWHEHYYPDECPPEWRIAYFMNDFRAVYLLESDWFENHQLIEAIAEELEEKFELVLQWPPDVTPQTIDEVLQQLTPLEQNVACMVLQADAQSPAALKQCVQKLVRRYAVNFDCSLPVSAETLATAKEYGIGFVWRGDDNTQHLMTGDYQLVVLPCPDLRQASAMLKRLQNAGREQAQPRIGIFLEASTHSPQRALELRTVIELMGMA